MWTRYVPALIEMIGLLATPPIVFWVLKLRAMAPVHQPDPYMHTTFIMDGSSILNRIGSVLTPDVLQDSTRVGFLVPARVTYLLFGPVPGFFALRYALALVAIVPTYCLLRTVYGQWAGWMGVVVLMTSTVVVGMWGSDYSSGAAVSYLLGGQAALALSLNRHRWHRLWLLAAAVLATLSIWSNGICLLIVLPTFAVYLVLRLKRDRHLLGFDVLLAIVIVIGTTGFLGILSKALLGWWDFIQKAISTDREIGPRALTNWHSVSWSWAPYELYLLVLPAIIVAFFIVFARRSAVPSSIFFIGMAGTLQVVIFSYLQFFNRFWIVETPEFSSFLWAAANLMLVLILSEIMNPSMLSVEHQAETSAFTTSGFPAMRKFGMALPAALVLAVPALYEAALRVPALTWFPWGFVLVGFFLAAALLSRISVGQFASFLHRKAGRFDGTSPFFSSAMLVVIVAANLVLTVAPTVPHVAPVNTSQLTPVADFDTVLGGNASAVIEEYRAVAKLPEFLGPPSYPGEQFMVWGNTQDRATGRLVGPIGFLGANSVSLQGTFPTLDETDQDEINAHRPAQIILMGFTNRGFPQAVSSLKSFGPRVIRRGVLGDHLYPLHVWLVDLENSPHSRPSEVADESK